MRGWLSFLSLLLGLLPAGSAFSQAFPEPKGYVNDFAEVISAPREQMMTNLILELKEKTGAEIAVATFPDIGGEDYTSYANRLFSAWKIGQENQDNGLLIFLAFKERKIRIEVGYGLEGILPDGKVGSILDTYVVPFLRQDNFDQGLYNAAAVTAATIADDAGVTLTGEPATEFEGDGEAAGNNTTLLIFLIILILVIVILSSRKGISTSSPGGNMTGGWGRGFGGFSGGFRGSHGGGGGFGGFGGGFSGGGGAGRGF